VRAALLDAWPALSHHFGLKPWDTPRLSDAEISRYLEAAKEMGRSS
jgi:hypothetical protein